MHVNLLGLTLKRQSEPPVWIIFGPTDELCVPHVYFGPVETSLNNRIQRLIDDDDDDAVDRCAAVVNMRRRTTRDRKMTDQMTGWKNNRIGSKKASCPAPFRPPLLLFFQPAICCVMFRSRVLFLPRVATREMQYTGRCAVLCALQEYRTCPGRICTARRRRPRRRRRTGTCEARRCRRRRCFCRATRTPP